MTLPPLGTLPLVATMLALGAGCSAGGQPPLVDAVDPFIGSGGLGFGVGSVNPGPTAPWGLVKLGPDTTSGSTSPSFAHDAGYYYDDSAILCFSHTHLYGTGAPDYGNVGLMPVLGPVTDATLATGYGSRFSHDTEVAGPGHYSVILDDSGIAVELTATPYSGCHRYTFPAGAADPVVVVDAARVLYGELAAGHVEVHPETSEITGSIVSLGALSGRYGGVPIHFVARFGQPFTHYGVWNDGEVQAGVTSQEGLTLGAYVGFDGNAGPVTAQVAISFISIEQAYQNLLHDEADFDTAREQTAAAWEEALGIIEIDAVTDDDRAIFYTALYHAMQMPTLMTEAGDLYRGFDGEVHQATGFLYHSDFSLWDTFRTHHPFLALALPDKQRDFVISLTKMYEQGGAFPRWPMGLGESGSMVGTSADIVIAESYLKGIADGYDIEAAYEGLRAHAVGPLPEGQTWGDRPGIEEYLALGYLPADLRGGSVSVTQEYSYDDFALAQLAAALGRDDDAVRFAAQARSYQNLWNPETRFFQGRQADGSFVTEFDPLEHMSDYIEGNAWQYRFYVPYDVTGLAELFGGADALCRELETFFEEAARLPDTALPDAYYWHGNEPDIHSAYVFALAGEPWLTQRWVRWILAAKYRRAPDGLDGNDDGGTLSSWYLLSAMGIFPIAGTDLYVIGSPILRRAALHLPGGDLIIEAPDTSGDHLYVQAATLNGTPLAEPFLRHADLAGGGVLRLEMGPEPSQWGAGARAL